MQLHLHEHSNARGLKRNSNLPDSSWASHKEIIALPWRRYFVLVVADSKPALTDANLAHSLLLLTKDYCSSSSSATTLTHTGTSLFLQLFPSPCSTQGCHGNYCNVTKTIIYYLAVRKGDGGGGKLREHKHLLYLPELKTLGKNSKTHVFRNICI